MPKPNPIADLALRLLEALRLRREKGATDFLTVSQLAAQLDPLPSLADALKAFKKKPVADQMLAAKADPGSPVALADDAARLADSPLLLEYAVGLLSTPKKPLHPVAKVAAKLDARLREPFAAAVQRRLDANDLPATIAVVRVKDVPHLCLKPYLPRLAPEVELAGKLLRALHEHRQRGDYPLTLIRLVRDADPQASAELVQKALAAKAFKPHVLLALPKNPETPLALAEDADRLARWPALVEAVLAQVSTLDNQAWVAGDLAKKLGKNLRTVFAEAVASAPLPETVGCVRIKAKSYLFLIREVGVKPSIIPVQAATAPTLDFAVRFETVFAEIDRRTGSHNFVSLVELRRALPVERGVFDEGLRQLRRAGRFTLSGAEGRHGISAEERVAGIHEDGALLLYVSLRR